MDFKRLFLSAVICLGYSATTNAAEVTLKQTHYVRAGSGFFFGHEHDHEEYQIKIRRGDNLVKIAGQLNALGLQDKVLCGKEKLVTVDDLVEQNPKITNPDLIYSGDTIKYSRVSYVRPGLITQF